MNKTMQLMNQAKAAKYNVRVRGFAQNCRNNQPEAVNATVTKVGQSVFYVGSKRYRPFFDLTQVTPFK